MKIVRIGADPAFDCFATFVLQNPRVYFPKIFSHTCPYGLMGAFGALSVTEMERLDPLSNGQQQAANIWVPNALHAMQKHQAIPAFHNLDLAYADLIAETRRHQQQNPQYPLFNGPDLQAKNFMIRPQTGDWVFIDGLG
jgi:hypothetical protein